MNVLPWLVNSKVLEGARVTGENIIWLAKLHMRRLGLISLIFTSDNI
jgi:hypothetical protein